MTSPSTTPSAWADPALLAKHGTSRPQELWKWAQILLLSVVDAFLIAPLIELVLNESPTKSLLIAAAVACAAAIGMHTAGRLHAGTRGQGRTHNPIAIVITLIWLGIGCTLAWLRLTGLSISTDVTGDSGDPTVSTTSDTVAAIALLLIYALAGILAFVHGSSRNDAHAAWGLSRVRLDQAKLELNQWEGILGRLGRERVRRAEDVAHVGAFTQHELERSQSLAAEAKAFARYEIARLKSDPTVSGITSPRHPDHPSFTPPSALSPAQHAKADNQG